MLVSSREYGSNALNEYNFNDDNAYLSPWEQQEIVEEPARKVVRITKKAKAKIMFKVILIAAMAFAAVFGYAIVSKANLEYLNSVNAVEEQQKINDNLKIQIADANYLNNIEKKAIAQNMFFPSSSQIKYIRLVSYNDIVKNDDTKKKENESKPWYIALFD